MIKVGWRRPRLEIDKYKLGQHELGVSIYKRGLGRMHVYGVTLHLWNCPVHVKIVYVGPNFEQE